MAFKYACFISYRHGQRELMETIIKDLGDALAGELEAWLEEDVFIDYERLRGGDFYNDALAKALCESVCMITVYVPTYFSDKHTFCSREYKAMEMLEERRLHALNCDIRSNHKGLIIPIVFRGFARLPKIVKKKRLCFDFQKFQLGSTKLSKHPQYASKITQIAEYIYDCNEMFQNLPNDLHNGCNDFCLPAEAEILEWLNDLKGVESSFPNRKGQR